MTSAAYFAFGPCRACRPYDGRSCRRRSRAFE